MSDGWTESAPAWIAAIDGDFSRLGVLDPPMLTRVRAGNFARALDVGCGEGRFCRMMREAGVGATVGVDPIPLMVETAQTRDPGGAYHVGRAEQLDFPDASFDLVVSYLSLIDIDGMEQAVAEMARVLRPGGTLLLANLNGFSTAGNWEDKGAAEPRYVFTDYLDARPNWVEWAGVRVRNWHRPLSQYMRAFLAHGMQLVSFDEPEPDPDWWDQARVARYRKAPWLVLMDWRKPEA